MNHPTPLQGELGSLGEQKRIMERLHKLSPNVCGSKTTVAEFVFPKKRCNSFFANLISCRLLCAHWDYDSSMPSSICRRTSYRAFDVRVWRKFKSPFNKGDNQSNNQNGNIRWIFSIRLGPPPPLLLDKISRHFFTPLFFFCNWILHRWNGIYTWSQKKISFLSPLIIYLKLTFISSTGRWLPTI